jgi:hypothetical protein
VIILGERKMNRPKDRRDSCEEDLQVLKFRCRDYLKSAEDRSGRHEEWTPESVGNSFTSQFNVVAPSDGENYYVEARLSKREIGGKKRYVLRFQDSRWSLVSSEYRPLRQLGNLVFSQD